ncbi:MAG TPA: polysaccharide deacetylase family protein [Phycisphaerales bacterium]|nr:polysaccharide deacetylase family protein [Phycisphaerales bacterium]
MSSQPLNILSVDVEDWYQAVSLLAGLPASERLHVAFRRGLHRLLDLLDCQGVKGTFFVLGMTAERDVSLVGDLASAGHEIATHGYGHRHLWQIPMEEFREDLRRGLGILRERTDSPILGHRAPQFSVPRDRTLEFFRVLVEEGLTYDSSVYPFGGRRYGLADRPREIHRVETPAGPILEVPLSVRTVLGRPLPVSGGGVWRLLPAFLIADCIRRLNRKDLPMVTYVHNYEFDPEPLRCEEGGIPRGIRSRRINFLQNLRRGSAYGKLRAMLEQFRFVPIREYLTAKGLL